MKPFKNTLLSLLLLLLLLWWFVCVCVCAGMGIFFLVCTCQRGECVRCVVTTLQVVTMERSPAAAAKCSSRGPLQVGARRTNNAERTRTHLQNTSADLIPYTHLFSNSDRAQWPDIMRASCLSVDAHVSLLRVKSVFSWALTLHDFSRFCFSR